MARQPIFNRDRRVWGYELLLRHSAKAQCAQVLDSDVATSTVMIDGFAMAQEWLLAYQRVLINYHASLLLQHASLALPAETAAVEILETVRPDEDILLVCRHLTVCYAHILSLQFVDSSESMARPNSKTHPKSPMF